MEERQADPEVMAEFNKRRTRQYIAIIPVVLVVGVLILSGRGDSAEFVGIPMTIVGPVCFAAILAIVIFSLFNWRCPACNVYLGRGMSPTFCRKCGERLQD